TSGVPDLVFPCLPPDMLKVLFRQFEIDGSVCQGLCGLRLTQFQKGDFGSGPQAQGWAPIPRTAADIHMHALVLMQAGHQRLLQRYKIGPWPKLAAMGVP